MAIREQRLSDQFGGVFWRLRAFLGKGDVWSGSRFSLHRIPYDFKTSSQAGCPCLFFIESLADFTTNGIGGRWWGTLYWDNISIPNGQSGTWDTTNPFWNANPTGLPAGPLTSWVQGDSAVFSAGTLGATGSFNVTLSQNVIVANLTYTGGSPGSQLSLSVGGANAIIMQNLQITVAVDANTTLFVQPAIVSGGLGGSLVLQSGNLILAGANTYGGGTTINAGSNLQIGD